MASVSQELDEVLTALVGIARLTIEGSPQAAEEARRVLMDNEGYMSGLMWRLKQDVKQLEKERTGKSRR